MKIKDILAKGQPTLSFEVFPPKEESNFASVEKAALEIAKLNPSFMSVTYGAGGGTSQYTVQIASDIQSTCQVPTLSHLTCVSSTREKVHSVLREIQAHGIENVLALRGDIPKDGKVEKDYQYASPLIREIRETCPELCIGAACYPEGHPEASTMDEDLTHLKEKVDAGCEYLTTQMFFDNNIYYRFMYKALQKGINVPVVPGIMPVTNAAQVKRTISLTGNLVPAKFLSIVDRFGDDPEAMKQAGIAYATEQIIDLIANGVNHIHIYSMNKPDVAGAIMDNLSSIYVRE